MAILVVNAGSSTVKFAVFDGSTRLHAETRETRPGDPSVFESILKSVSSFGIQAVGHRLVHGGDIFTAPIRLNRETLTQLELLQPLAPLHLPMAIEGIRAVERFWPGCLQVACFDTAFHATLPPSERRFGIPRRFHHQGIRRYGFHGLSYESIANRLPEVSMRAATGRTVVCHLGNGASLCGMLNRISRTTTMGFTPLDGLLMSTRPGRLDPGIILHWLKAGMGEPAIHQILERESGLLGVSGIASDMRELLASSSSEAVEAVELFSSMVAKEIAAAATVLEGLDAIVFTAGIGEHAPSVRTMICDRLRWFGVKLDTERNHRQEDRLHTEDSAIELYRLKTDEESVLARQTVECIGEPH